MTKIVFGLLLCTFISSFSFAEAKKRKVASEDKVPKVCANKIYQAVKANKNVHKGQWANSFVLEDYYSGFNVFFQVTKDMGQQNYCEKAGHALVKFEGENCTVQKIEVDEDNQFDCG